MSFSEVNFFLRQWFFEVILFKVNFLRQKKEFVCDWFFEAIFLSFFRVIIF